MKREHKIRCINTGKLYKSMLAASKELGVSAVNISDVCNRRRAHIKGLKFEIVEVGR